MRTGTTSARYVDCDDSIRLCCSNHLSAYSGLCGRTSSLKHVQLRACVRDCTVCMRVCVCVPIARIVVHVPHK
jgi:hypothetical protein